MAELADTFALEKYVVCRSLVKEPNLSLFYKYACKRATGGSMSLTDDQAPGTPSAGKDFMMDGLLSDLIPSVEHACGLKVFPTYSYFRVYKRGDVLARHTDRPACEISISLCLGYQAERPWPIWIEGRSRNSSVELAPGDAILYRGIECAHWREAFDGEHQAQVFLHYVDQNGPYTEWKFDKRASATVIDLAPLR